jgi:hypothetical protein
MRFLSKVKDGGPNSPVDAYVLIEIKSLFSIMFLKFNPGSRETYHSHAFNAWTWFIFGDMWEEKIVSPQNISSGGPANACIEIAKYRRSLHPKLTPRSLLHNVIAYTTSWCFTVRGPWEDQWIEYDIYNSDITTLTHGRKVIKEEKVGHGR